MLESTGQPLWDRREAVTESLLLRPLPSGETLLHFEFAVPADANGTRRLERMPRAAELTLASRAAEVQLTPLAGGTQQCWGEQPDQGPCCGRGCRGRWDAEGGACSHSSASQRLLWAWLPWVGCGGGVGRIATLRPRAMLWAWLPWVGRGGVVTNSHSSASQRRAVGVTAVAGGTRRSGTSSSHSESQRHAVDFAVVAGGTQSSPLLRVSDPASLGAMLYAWLPDDEAAGDARQLLRHGLSERLTSGSPALKAGGGMYCHVLTWDHIYI